MSYKKNIYSIHSSTNIKAYVVSQAAYTVGSQVRIPFRGICIHIDMPPLPNLQAPLCSCVVNLLRTARNKRR
jgi:hypothetical protein